MGRAFKVFEVYASDTGEVFDTGTRNECETYVYDHSPAMDPMSIREVAK